MDDLSAQPTGSILLASEDWAETKAAYRLLDNDALDGRELADEGFNSRHRASAQAFTRVCRLPCYP